MSSTKFLKLKKQNLIYYSLSDTNNYNIKSKENLVQYAEICEQGKKELKKIQDQNKVDCIKNYSVNFLLKYSEIMKKEYKSTFSITQQKKISDSTNTFIDVVKHNYKKSKGYNQRMITFVTLTIPENQKHTDKVLVKTLVDFIDHLKKVKNTVMQNKLDTGFQILSLENYVWRAETTEKGNIHFHLLFDCYVNHETLKRVWNNYLTKLGYENGQNSANIHNLKNINDVGSYVVKYMTKEPLNDEYAKKLKTKQITKDDLKQVNALMKYRRPILYLSWGSSLALKTLKAPTFTGSEILDFNELKDKCTLVELPEEIKDYVKIYKGKIYDLLNECSKNLKNIVKNNFNRIFDWLYKKSDDERKYLDDLIKLHRVNFDIQNVFDGFKPIEKKSFIPQLF